MITVNKTSSHRSYLVYYTDKKCVVCKNPDFKRIASDTNKVLQDHKLNHIRIGANIIVFCNSCLYSLKEELKRR